MFDDNGNSVVTVKRAQVLAVLQDNLKTHRAIFLQAQEGYRRTVIAQLEKSLADARENRRIEQFVRLAEPIDHTHDYERTIKMLEMSVSDEVKLSEAEFACYVMDDWSWKKQFLTTSMAYGAGE